MLLRARKQTKPQPASTMTAETTKPATPDYSPALQALYERIARGHGLAQAEEQARRKWQ